MSESKLREQMAAQMLRGMRDIGINRPERLIVDDLYDQIAHPPEPTAEEKMEELLLYPAGKPVFNRDDFVDALRYGTTVIRPEMAAVFKVDGV